MVRITTALVVAAVLAGTFYWRYNHDDGIGSPCGGDFHVKPCPQGLVCVPKHPWSGGMGTSGTCRPPVRPDPSSQTPPLPAHGAKLIPPIKGPPTLSFNGTTRTGGKSRGLVWEPNPPAEVVSPGSGHVVHAEDFRGYGNLVIIQSGGGFHLLIAGLSTLVVKHGDAVQPGTPLGTATTEAAPASNNENAPNPANPTVYFELRKDGEPIDPSPWISTP